ncbi:MAG: DUF2155 domain-containing protein [Pseudomonadota bacterium]
MILRLAIALALCAQVLFAQITATPLEDFAPDQEAEIETGPEAGSARAATVRMLDKMTGMVNDLTIETGGSVQQGFLEIALSDCRYPLVNPASDAFAYLEIRDTARDRGVFAGWMIASSPALSALDHSRYDVWVLSCETTS